MGTGITEMPPGSQKGIQIVVDDAAAARKHLIDHGVEATEIDEQPWGRFVFFSRPRRQRLVPPRAAAAELGPKPAHWPAANFAES